MLCRACPLGVVSYECFKIGNCEQKGIRVSVRVRVTSRRKCGSFTHQREVGGKTITACGMVQISAQSC